MKAFAALTAFVSLAAASPVALQQAPSPLVVGLEMAGNSKIQATVTNNGTSEIKLLKVGSLLDSAAVEKTKVTAKGTSIPFEGVRLRIATGSLREPDFQRIAPGKSVAVIFDAAQAHDLSGGGVFRFQVEGAFSFAENDANEVVGSFPYTSNVLEAKVDGDYAAAVRIAFHERRSQLQDTCSGQRLAVTQKALQNCQSMALNAQAAAESGPVDKLIEYYKRSDSVTRATVADVFRKVAQECGSTDSGIAKYHCEDYYSNCASRVLAYTVTSRNIMVFCPLYFNNLPAVAGECHKQDQATTNIHEVTHLYDVKGTSDYGGYGYNFIRSLTPDQNINHADTYALFANAIYLDC